jgi:hypothetical protein
MLKKVWEDVKLVLASSTDVKKLPFLAIKNGFTYPLRLEVGLSMNGQTEYFEYEDQAFAWQKKF